MKKVGASQIDYASENIDKLQELRKKLATVQQLDQGLLHQYLDQESLYIKQIPSVSVVMCKV